MKVRRLALPSHHYPTLYGFHTKEFTRMYHNLRSGMEVRGQPKSQHPVLDLTSTCYVKVEKAVFDALLTAKEQSELTPE